MDTGAAGTVPLPVAAMIDGSAWRNSHSMVSPSERWPSSLVSWKIRAAQRGGIRTRRPRPLTFVWRSLVEREEDNAVDFRGTLWLESAVVVVVGGPVLLAFGSDWWNLWRTTSELILKRFGFRVLTGEKG